MVKFFCSVKFFSSKTSKINLIILFIIFSTCVLWSQHASPLLLSHFNRWLKPMEGKSVLALARSNGTMRKVLHVWTKIFNKTIFRIPHAALFFLAPFPFSSYLQEYMSPMYAASPFQICSAFVHVDMGVPQDHSWNPETRILLLSQQEESGLGCYK